MPAGPSRHYQRPEILGRGRVQSKCMLIDVRKVRNAHLCGYAITDHGPLTLPQDYSRVWPALERGAIKGLRHREIICADDALQNVIAVCVV